MLFDLYFKFTHSKKICTNLRCQTRRNVHRIPRSNGSNGLQRLRLRKYFRTVDFLNLSGHRLPRQQLKLKITINPYTSTLYIYIYIINVHIVTDGNVFYVNSSLTVNVFTCKRSSDRMAHQSVLSARHLECWSCSATAAALARAATSVRRAGSPPCRWLVRSKLNSVRLVDSVKVLVF